MTATPWARFVTPYAVAIGPLGAALPGATLSFYSSGTATPLDTYNDENLTIPNTNPVVADANGVFESIFLQALSYKVVYKDVDGTEIWTADPVSPIVLSGIPTTAVFSVALPFRYDGHGAVVALGVAGDGYIPFAGTITGWALQADQTGDLIVDVWVAPFVTDSPPTGADSITAALPPTLTSNQQVSSTILTGWTTAIGLNDAIRFNVNSATTVTRFTLTLIVSRTITLT